MSAIFDCKFKSRDRTRVTFSRQNNKGRDNRRPRRRHVASYKYHSQAIICMILDVEQMETSVTPLLENTSWRKMYPLPQLL